jgi:hypothetical protein
MDDVPPNPAPPTGRRSIVRWIIALFVIAAVATAGTILAVGGVESFGDLISPTLIEVTGRITFNGKPLSSGFVQTYYDRRGWMGALAEIAPDGSFRLTTNGDPGAFSGKHRVIVRWMDNSSPPRSVLPERYTQPQTTPLLIHVSRSGGNVVTLDLVDAEGAESVPKN